VQRTGTISSRTPEGEPNRCPVCGHQVRLEPSRPAGDGPCPFCGTLLWFSMKPPAPVVTAWEYGVGLIQQEQLAAGLELLQTVVAHKPNDVAQRRALRQIERSAVGGRELADASASAVLSEVWWEIHQARHKRAAEFVDWDAIDRAAERGLAVAPQDAELHVQLGNACRARGYLDVARFAYQCALEIAPDRRDVREALG